MRRERLAKGLWGVLATPFTDEGQLDESSMERQLELHRLAGSVGLVALGVFGEASRLTTEEQDRVVELVGSRSSAPLVVGLPDLSTDSAIATANRLQAKLPAGREASFMVQANTGESASLIPHLTAIHEATGAGVVLQDYPVASGVQISSTELVATVHDCPFVVAVKSEAPPTSLAIAQIVPHVGDVPVFGGLGGLGLLDELMAGAAGAMTGFSYPEALAQVLQAFQSGGYAAAREAYLPWLPLVNFEAQLKIGLGIRKASLLERGIFASSAVRPPAPPIDDALLPLLRSHLEPLRDRGVM